MGALADSAQGIVNIFKQISAWLSSIPSAKTVYFNFRYFPFDLARKLPVEVSNKVSLVRTEGSITINGPVHRGMISIGYGHVPIFDKATSRSVWNVMGSIVFNGPAQIGHGSKISVDPAGTLTIGRNLIITAETTIVCARAITLGDGVLMSWNIQIMDTDYHKILKDGERINADAPITIGNHVWINSRATILKGTVIPDGCVVAASALLATAYTEPECVIGGVPARVLTSGITWSH